MRCKSSCHSGPQVISMMRRFEGLFFVACGRFQVVCMYMRHVSASTGTALHLRLIRVRLARCVQESTVLSTRVLPQARLTSGLAHWGSRGI